MTPHKRPLSLIVALLLAIPVLSGLGSSVAPTAAASGKVGAASSKPVIGFEEVVTITRRGGITTATAYVSAPGVSGEELLRSLQAQGVEGDSYVAHDGESGIGTFSNDPGSGGCPIYWSTAKFIGCGYPRWQSDAIGNVWVHFNDTTGSRWPVSAVTADWHQRLRVSVSRGGCSSGAGHHCVIVREGNFGTKWVGRVSIAWSGTEPNVFFIGPVDLDLNNQINTDSEWRRETTCHEAGHALGLGHNSSHGSCIYGYHTSSRSEYPNADDVSALNWLYRWPR